MEIQEKQRLEFRWERRSERYVFRCKAEASGNTDQFHEQLDENWNYLKIWGRFSRWRST